VIVRPWEMAMPQRGWWNQCVFVPEREVRPRTVGLLVQMQIVGEVLVEMFGRDALASIDVCSSLLRGGCPRAVEARYLREVRLRGL
jgi:hypothetical protein